MNEAFSFIDSNIRRDLISGYEYALLPFYLLIIYFATRILIWKYYRNTPYVKYIQPAVFLKVFGGIFICLVYNYYYRGGDTSMYFVDANNLSKVLLHDPVKGIRVLFSPAGDFPREYKYLVTNFYYLQSEDTFLIVRITTIVQLFAFNSFLLTSALFGYLSFWASWQLYTLFAKIYPSLYKQLAYSILFIPSVLAWGSGILKDTVTLAALCLLVTVSYKLIIRNRISAGDFVIASLAILLLSFVKIYILIAAIPSLFLLKIRHVQSIMKRKALTILLTPVFIIFMIILGVFTAGRISNYSENILEKSRIQREYLYSLSKEMGSGYTLGTLDTPIDLVLNFPGAVNVTFFRPYLWESHNVIMFASALESFVIFIITLYCLIKYGFLNSFTVMKRDPFLVFCLIFSVLFGFFVGVSTYNFGSLVRYKIPALPFYLSAMLIIYYTKKKNYAEKK